MLHITSAQLATFAACQRQRFIAQCCAQVETEFPALAASTPDLSARIERLVSELEGFGFIGADETQYALSLLIRHNQQAEHQRMPEDIVARLRSRNVTVEKKIEALEQLSIFGGETAPMAMSSAQVPVQVQA